MSAQERIKVLESILRNLDHLIKFRLKEINGLKDRSMELMTSTKASRYNRTSPGACRFFNLESDINLCEKITRRSYFFLVARRRKIVAAIQHEQHLLAEEEAANKAKLAEKTEENPEATQQPVEESQAV